MKNSLFIDLAHASVNHMTNVSFTYKNVLKKGNIVSNGIFTWKFYPECYEWEILAAVFCKWEKLSFSFLLLLTYISCIKSSLMIQESPQSCIILLTHAWNKELIKISADDILKYLSYIS